MIHILVLIFTHYFSIIQFISCTLCTGGEYDKATLRRALEQTAEKCGSAKILAQYREIIQEVRDSDTLRKQRSKYSGEYDYAKGVSFDDTCYAIQKIMDEL